MFYDQANVQMADIPSGPAMSEIELSAVSAVNSDYSANS